MAWEKVEISCTATWYGKNGEAIEVEESDLISVIYGWDKSNGR